MKNLNDLGYIKTNENDRKIIYKNITDYKKQFLGVIGQVNIIIILKTNGNAFVRSYLKMIDKEKRETPFCINNELWNAITEVAKEFYRN